MSIGFTGTHRMFWSSPGLQVVVLSYGLPIGVETYIADLERQVAAGRGDVPGATIELDRARLARAAGSTHFRDWRTYPDLPHNWRPQPWPFP